MKYCRGFGDFQPILKIGIFKSAPNRVFYFGSRHRKRMAMKRGASRPSSGGRGSSGCADSNHCYQSDTHYLGAASETPSKRRRSSTITPVLRSSPRKELGATRLLTRGAQVAVFKLRSSSLLKVLIFPKLAVFRPKPAVRAPETKACTSKSDGQRRPRGTFLQKLTCLTSPR